MGRLEAATSRLEDIATATELPKDVPALNQTTATPTDASSAATRPPVGAMPTTSGPKQAVEQVPEAIEEFQQFISSSVDKYAKISNEIGGVVAKQVRDIPKTASGYQLLMLITFAQAAEVVRGFQEQSKFLLITTRATKPDASTYQTLLKPINDALMAVTEIKDSNRSDPMYPHLSAVADGIMMLAWITLDNRPYKHVEESLGSAQFFGNRVLKEQKDK